MRIVDFAVSASIAAVHTPVTAGWTTSLSPRAKLLHWFDLMLDQFQERQKHLANHIYLHDNFAPVDEEHEGIPVDVIQGQIPRDLDGLVVRNGPNPIPTQISKRYHWFDGHGMLHNLRFKNGAACYSNAYIPIPRYLIEKKFGSHYFGNFGEMTGLSGVLIILLIYSQMAEALGVNRNTVGQANTHTSLFQDKFYCCHEASCPFEIALNDKGGIDKPIGYEAFGGRLTFPVSAHPKRDFRTGNLLFHGYTTDDKLSRKEARVKVGEYSVRRNKLLYYLGANPGDRHWSMVHDMMFTKNWMVLYDSSVHFDAKHLFVPNESCFGWTPSHNLRFGLLPRTGNVSADDVIWFDTGRPQAVIHLFAAWEEPDGTVVLWAPVGDDFDGSLVRANFFYMVEYRMNPQTKEMTKTVIDRAHNVEFPRVRDNCLGQFCRYGYSGILDHSLGGEGLLSGFIAWDMMEKKIRNVVKFPEGDIGGEPLLIPKPGTTASDAVYIGAFVHNTKEGTSNFALYDVETSLGEPVARLRIPYRVPYGCHSQWVEGTELSAHINYHAGKNGLHAATESVE